MIRLDQVTLTTRARLDRVSFDFTQGIWHVGSDPADDARTLIHLLAGQIAPDAGAVRCVAPRSWPLGQTIPFGKALRGVDSVDTLASLYGLDRGATLRLFRDLLTDPDWLTARFDRWPAALQRQFGHIAFLAPVFDIYLLDISPILPDPRFVARWLPLFRERIAGRVVIVAAAGHRAALRQLPGTQLMLRGGTLYRSGLTDGPLAAMAAE